MSNSEANDQFMYEAIEELAASIEAVGKTLDQGPRNRVAELDVRSRIAGRKEGLDLAAKMIREWICEAAASSKD